MAFLNLNGESFFVEDQLLAEALKQVPMVRLISVSDFAKKKGISAQAVGLLWKDGPDRKINPDDVYRFDFHNANYLDAEKYQDIPIGKDKARKQNTIPNYKPRKK